MVSNTYFRLDRVGQRSSRALMLHFHCLNCDYKSAAEFLSTQFGTRLNLLELVLAMHIRLKLHQVEEATLLARRCVRSIAAARYPEMKTLLLAALGDYFTRARKWALAVDGQPVFVQIHRLQGALLQK